MSRDPVWNEIEGRVKAQQLVLGHNRFQIHTCTLMLDCLRYSDPQVTGPATEVLEEVLIACRNHDLTFEGYLEIRKKLREAKFESLPDFMTE